MASTYLTRTPSSAGSRTTWTWSGWIKRSKVDASAAVNIFYSAGTASTNDMSMYFNLNDQLEFFNRTSSSVDAYLVTNRRFRDTSAWYHIVFHWDSSNATAGDRMKIYVNGVEETSFATDTNPSLNLSSQINNNVQHELGANSTPSGYFDGLIAHVNFIDGTLYDPSYFGQTETSSGIWKPKVSPSVTYGTNGFFLKFQDSSSFGDDSSGNTNDFTVANGTPTQTLDTPSNVFCVLNRLNQTNSVNCENGNTTFSQSANDQGITGTLGFTKGKWYWEMYPKGTASNHLPEAGIILNTSLKVYSGLTIAGGTTQPTGILRVFNNTGTTNNMRAMGSTTNTTVGAAVTYTRDSDYINVAVDADAGKIWFGKNGTYEGGGDPAAGTNPTYDWSSNLSSVEFIVPAIIHAAGADQDTQFNFGNGYFGTTAVASANSDSAGIGQFEYAVPSGYYALCTKNIAEYG